MMNYGFQLTPLSNDPSENVLGEGYKVVGNGYVVLVASGTASVGPANITTDFTHSTPVPSAATGSVNPSVQTITVHNRAGSADNLPQLQYVDVYSALNELQSPGVGSEWQIAKPVYNSSIAVANWLRDSNAAPPNVSNHGPKSVVFGWEDRGSTFHITVTDKHLSLLKTNMEGAVQRGEISTTSYGDTQGFFAALGSNRLLTTL